MTSISQETSRPVIWDSSDKNKTRGVRGEEFLDNCEVGDIIRFTDGTVTKPIFLDFRITSKDTEKDKPVFLGDPNSPLGLMRHIHGKRILKNGKDGETRVSIFQVSSFLKDSVTISFHKR